MKLTRNTSVPQKAKSGGLFAQGDFGDISNRTFARLKDTPDYVEMTAPMVRDDETVIGAFKSIRDGVVFLDKRAIIINAMGFRGRRKMFTVLPYRSITAYAIETGGDLENDPTLVLHSQPFGRLRFVFKGQTNLPTILQHIETHAT